MRVFLAGASGVIGTRLVPLLVSAGHEVAGMTRSPERAPALSALGARPVVCDVFDAPALRAAMTAFAPDTVLHQLTALPDDPSLIAAHAEANNRIRRQGTRLLLDAAHAAGAARFLAQSVAWRLPGDGAEAIAEMERAVLEAGGVVIRYGRFFGPGTYYPAEPPAPPRIQVDEAARRTIAILGAASGVLTVADSEGGVRPPAVG